MKYNDFQSITFTKNITKGKQEYIIKKYMTDVMELYSFLNIREKKLTVFGSWIHANIKYSLGEPSKHPVYEYKYTFILRLDCPS